MLSDARRLINCEGRREKNYRRWLLPIACKMKHTNGEYTDTHLIVGEVQCSRTKHILTSNLTYYSNRRELDRFIDLFKSSFLEWLFVQGQCFITIGYRQYAFWKLQDVVNRNPSEECAFRHTRGFSCQLKCRSFRYTYDKGREILQVRVTGCHHSSSMNVFKRFHVLKLKNQLSPDHFEEVAYSKLKLPLTNYTPLSLT
jgi:hypothetical protein